MKNFGVTPPILTAHCRWALLKLHRWDLIAGPPRTTGVHAVYSIAGSAHERQNPPPWRRRCPGLRTRI